MIRIESVPLQVPNSHLPRRATTWFLLAGLFCGPMLVAMAGIESLGESESARRARLAEMNGSEIYALRQNKELFDSLPSEEKTRIRKLHTDLTSAADSEQLLQVLTRYAEWLKQQDPLEESKIKDAPHEDRIAIIKRKQQEEANRALGVAGPTKLPAQDVAKLKEWQKLIIENARKQSLDGRGSRGRLEDLAAIYRESDLERLKKYVSEQNLDDLQNSLSAEGQAIMQQHQDQRLELVHAWLRADFFSSTQPPEEELLKFFDTLTIEQQDESFRLSERQWRIVMGFGYFQYYKNGEKAPPDWPRTRNAFSGSRGPNRPPGGPPPPSPTSNDPTPNK
jgi:hypothetical protein